MTVDEQIDQLDNKIKASLALYADLDQRINILQNRVTNLQESFAKIHNTVISIQAGLKDRNLKEKLVLKTSEQVDAFDRDDMARGDWDREDMLKEMDEQ